MQLQHLGLEVKENVKWKKIYMLHLLGVLLPFIVRLLMYFTSLFHLSEGNCPYHPLWFSLQLDSDCLPSAPVYWEPTSDKATDGSTEPYLFSQHGRTITWVFLSVQADLRACLFAFRVGHLCSNKGTWKIFFLQLSLLLYHLFPLPYHLGSDPLPALTASVCTASLSFFSPLLRVFYVSAFWQCSSQSSNGYNTAMKRKREMEMGFVALWI